MKTKHIIFLLLILSTVSGCDFFRKVAGRPTSSDIQEKKILVERDKAEKAAAAQEQARLDSLAEIERQAALAEEAARKDSLAALDFLSQEKCLILPPSTLKGLASGELSHRYHIMMGSFKDEANADKLMMQIRNKSELEPVKMYFRNKRVAVGVCPCNKVTELVEVLDEVKTYPFCPKDAWILVNE